MAAQRLHQAASAHAPITGIALGVFGQSASVRIAFDVDATAPQRAAAQAAVDAFDWSTDAQQAWEEAAAPERRDLRQAAAQALTDLDAFLGLGSPTNAQTLAIVRRLCQIQKAVLRRVVQL